MAFQRVGTSIVNQTVLPPPRQNDGRKRGRPKMLVMQPDLIENIAEHVRLGMFYTEAAALEGVTSQSVQVWMKKGNADLDSGDDSTPEARFALAVKKAAAEAEAESVQAIRRAGSASIPGAWMAHAWYLERKYPDRYGKQDRQQVELKGKLGIGVITANLDGKPEDMPDDGSDKLARIAGILASGPITGPSED